MGSSFQQWESDPLFSAAEVVQDSADRMESIFRLLLHEKGLDQGDQSDPRLLASINSHRRDLMTVLETTKWQLEDFERAANSSFVSEGYPIRENVGARHRQFIQAIREQVNRVQYYLEDAQMESPAVSSKWVHLNEQDSKGLALFLSGGNHSEHLGINDNLNDAIILGRFLDPASASGSHFPCINGNDGEEIEELEVNVPTLVDNCYDPTKEKNLRKVNSHHSIKMNVDVEDFCQDNSYSRNADKSDWGLEARGAKLKCVFLKKKLRVFSRVLELNALLNKIWTRNGHGISRNYTKRFKDGEDYGYAPLNVGTSCATESQHLNRHRLSFSGVLAMVVRPCMRIGVANGGYHQFFRHIPSNKKSTRRIFTVIFTLTIIGLLVLQLT